MKTPTENPVPWTPCRFLRTKRMYIPALADGALDLTDETNSQSCYWCNKTLAALGVDDNQVHPCLCQPGRACHES